MIRNVLVALCVVAVLLSGCSRKKQTATPEEPSQETVDTAQPADTVPQTPKVVQRLQPADSSFDEFVVQFAQDKQLQLQRINFPLHLNVDGVKTTVKKESWKHDPLFFDQTCYTLLFDSEEEIDRPLSDSLKQVDVDWIYPAELKRKRYSFERVDGRWMLQAINHESIAERGMTDFLHFYHRFVTDSIVQEKSLDEPLNFVTPDPDDEFSILETTLDKQQWYAFRPDLPKERLSNISYSHYKKPSTQTKVLLLKGVENGLSNLLYFRKQGEAWKLYKFEDAST